MPEAAANPTASYAKLPTMPTFASVEEQWKYAGVEIQRETMDVGGTEVVNDWDEELFIVDKYEEYLTAVERGCRTNKDFDHIFGGGKRYSQETVFEEYLGDCLKILEEQKRVLAHQQARGWIDQRVRMNGMQVREMSMEAIRKYLEQTHRQRLTGV